MSACLQGDVGSHQQRHSDSTPYEDRPVVGRSDNRVFLYEPLLGERPDADGEGPVERQRPRKCRPCRGKACDGATPPGVSEKHGADKTRHGSRKPKGCQRMERIGCAVNRPLNSLSEAGQPVTAAVDCQNRRGKPHATADEGKER